MTEINPLTDSGTAVAELRAARDFLLDHREDYDAARAGFVWPRPDRFNVALDWFDGVLAAEHPDRDALRIVGQDGTRAAWSYRELSQSSSQLAGWLRAHGVARGERVLMLLGNQVELWTSMLALIKLGAVLIPASTLLAPADLRDRIERGHVGHVIARSEIAPRFAEVPGSYTRIAMGEPVEGWLRYSDAASSLDPFSPDGPTPADDPMLLYFTSGTTALPKLVEHTNVSYPIGHLSTMYWIGLRPGDVHLNLSSPGWAKHAWSNVFAPWLAGATIAIYDYARFDPAGLLRVLQQEDVTTFCAPPTVWRMLIQADLASTRTSLREVVAAGEPLNPEVIAQVQRAWGLTIRDGFGQTETSLQIANSPGQPVKPGSMGRPMPGFPVVLADPVNSTPGLLPGEEGEICLDLADRPVGLMTGYKSGHGQDDERTADAMAHGLYHTGDVATMDQDGYVFYVGRTDDVFKASDYRISPFELESVLIEHAAVAEAAVVPSPDPLRLAVPKAYVVLAAGHRPDADTARSILQHVRDTVAPYKRIRRLQFAELPKTISGKIRRVELRAAEQLHADVRPDGEYRDDDFDLT